jgi:hypothetical protein
MFLKILGVGVLVTLPVVATAQRDPDAAAQAQPDFSIVVQGTFDRETAAEFNRRLQDYAALRNRLEVGLPPLVVTDNPDEIEDFEHRLAERIDEARGSRRGQLFAPAMEGQLKRMLVAQADAATIAAIMDDGPSEFDIDINEAYSKKRSLGTVPPKLLRLLPELPQDLYYRFVGRHLILYDGRANIIIDEIPYALQCHECVLEPEDEDDEPAVDEPEPPVTSR